jgi:hypothetical protein
VNDVTNIQRFATLSEVCRRNFVPENFITKRQPFNQITTQ